jgi:hypothetical protein
MKKIFYSTFLLLFANCLLPINLAAQEANPVNGPHHIKSSYFAFTNATIFVDASNQLSNATLVIKAGKIENVGVGIAIPKDAKVIDLKGIFKLWR